MGKDWLTRLDLPTRLRGARYARAAFVTLLAGAAVGQAITQAVTLSGSGADGSHQAGFPAVLTAEYALPLSLLALLATVPLAAGRPAPAAVVVTFGNAVALASFGYVTAGGLVAELIGACWLGVAGGLEGAITMGRYLAVGLGVPFLVIALAEDGLGGPGGLGGRAAVLLASAVPVAGGIGIAVWSGRLARTRTEAGEALADTLLAHTARGERARIARELHDVVAHHISMIAVLSETGRLTTPGLPDAGARRFAEIGDTARAGLTEMRRLLGVLREDVAEGRLVTGPGPVTGGRASRQPQPGLMQLTELVATARDASMTGTRLIISGPVAPLDPGVELAAYRIVQEALTNTRRHAPGAAVDVEVRYSPESLRLRVRDNGPGPGTGGRTRPAGGRHGLLGMRERAFSVGGTLQVGVAAGGGFLVEAVLPAGQDLVPVPRASAGTEGLSGTGGLVAGSGR